MCKPRSVPAADPPKCPECGCGESRHWLIRDGALEPVCLTCLRYGLPFDVQPAAIPEGGLREAVGRLERVLEVVESLAHDIIEAHHQAVVADDVLPSDVFDAVTVLDWNCKVGMVAAAVDVLGPFGRGRVEPDEADEADEPDEPALFVNGGDV